jgi:hypothetical protein
MYKIILKELAEIAKQYKIKTTDRGIIIKVSDTKVIELKYNLVKLLGMELIGSLNKGMWTIPSLCNERIPDELVARQYALISGHQELLDNLDYKAPFSLAAMDIVKEYIRTHKVEINDFILHYNNNNDNNYEFTPVANQDDTTYRGKPVYLKDDKLVTKDELLPDCLNTTCGRYNPKAKYNCNVDNWRTGHVNCAGFRPCKHSTEFNGPCCNMPDCTNYSTEETNNCKMLEDIKECNPEYYYSTVAKCHNNDCKYYDITQDNNCGIYTDEVLVNCDNYRDNKLPTVDNEQVLEQVAKADKLAKEGKLNRYQLQCYNDKCFNYDASHNNNCTRYIDEDVAKCLNLRDTKTIQLKCYNDKCKEYSTVMDNNCCKFHNKDMPECSDLLDINDRDRS